MLVLGPKLPRRPSGMLLGFRSRLDSIMLMEHSVGAGVLLHQGATPDGIGPSRFLRAAELLHELRRSPSPRNPSYWFGEMKTDN